MMIKSVKQGTLVLQVTIFPVLKHTSHQTSKLTGSYFKKSFSSKGLTKLSLSPHNYFSSSCFTSISALVGLYPIAINSSTVLLKQLIYIFLSSFGANGFFMFEFPLGSLTVRVSGKCFPWLYQSSFQRNQFNFVYSSSPYDLVLRVLLMSSYDLCRIDSIVVISALLDGGRVSSNYRSYKVQCQDFIIYRLRSSVDRHRKCILTPKSGNLPANCTQLLVDPQCWQAKEQIMISLKRGMEVISMVVVAD